MSRATGYWAVIGLYLMLGAVPLFCAADHCADGPAGAVVRQSVFAHGYLHGYEAGFHTGNVDLQEARVRDRHELREFEKPLRYEPVFGSRRSFTAGFRRGFLAGYLDSVAGRDFRAFKILRLPIETDESRHPDFDQGFQDGYKAGDTVGTKALEADGDFDPGNGACPARPAGDGRLPPSSQAYCAGYLSAYRLGYTDGFVFASPGGDSGSVVAAK